MPLIASTTFRLLLPLIVHIIPVIVVLRLVDFLVRLVVFDRCAIPAATCCLTPLALIALLPPRRASAVR